MPFDVENILPEEIQIAKQFHIKCQKKNHIYELIFFPNSTIAIIEEIASRKFENSNMTTP